MEYISPTQEKFNYKDKRIHKNFDDPNMIEILEDIVESSIDKKGFFLESFPINSDTSNIYNYSERDSVFYIHKKNNEKFGISCDKNNYNDYYHIDPINWKKISKNRQELNLPMLIDNKKQNIKFKETNSIEELKRINKLFFEEL